MKDLSTGTRYGAGDVWRWSTALLVTSFLIYMGTGTFADPDLWGHVLFGQLHLEQGGVVRTDPFAFVPTRTPWMNHEWLAEVWFALLYGLGGDGLLITFKLLAMLCLFGLVVVGLRHQGSDLARSALLAVPFFFSVMMRLTVVRPQIFTLLAFAVLLLCLRLAEDGRPRWLLLLPFLFAAWINFHGGVLAGLAVLSLWSLARLGSGLARLRHEGREALQRWIVSLGILLLAAAATLLNPYGLEHLAFLAETATVERPYISEWQPLEIRSAIGGAYLLQIALLGAGLIRSDRDAEPALIVPLAAIAVLPLMAIRHVALFGLAGPLLAGDHLAALFRGRQQTATTSVAGWARYPLIAIMIPLSGLLLWKTRTDLGCAELRPGSYPIEAVEWLKASESEPRLATFFNWGEYVIWHLGPGTKVSMDGRRETVYPDSVYREYLAFIKGNDDWYSYLEKYGADAALVEVGHPPDNLLELKPGWEEAYRDSLAVVHARVNSPLLADSIRARADSIRVPDGPLCFPYEERQGGDE